MLVRFTTISSPLDEDDIRRGHACPDHDSADRRLGPEVRRWPGTHRACRHRQRRSPGASGDRQFRMYVRLMPNAREMLERSREFKRGVDNSIYHKGYPLNYREQRGTPSIQFSIALDGRQADIDVDYRSSMFPVGLLNGHLSSANSDVRAGNDAVGMPRSGVGISSGGEASSVSASRELLTPWIRPPRLHYRRSRAQARRISR